MTALPLIVALLAAVLFGFILRSRGTSERLASRPTGRRVWPWWAALGVVGACELFCYFELPRFEHPTFSSLYDSASSLAARSRPCSSSGGWHWAGPSCAFGRGQVVTWHAVSLAIWAIMALLLVGVGVAAVLSNGRLASVGDFGRVLLRSRLSGAVVIVTWMLGWVGTSSPGDREQHLIEHSTSTSGPVLAAEDYRRACQPLHAASATRATAVTMRAS